MVIFAPYPVIEVTSILPNPQFNNIKQGQITLVKHTSTDGTLRFYNRRNPRHLLSLTWVGLTVAKVDELQAVLAAYYDKEMRLDYTWLENPYSYKAYLKTNPWQHVFSTRDTEAISLDFEGIQL